jgi:hypothetical protein
MSKTKTKTEKELRKLLEESKHDFEKFKSETKKIEEYRKYIEETAWKVKTLQHRLKPWSDIIDYLEETAFKRGHVFLPLKRITKPDGKRVVVSDRPIVLKEKILKQLFVKGVPLGNILFTNLPELRARVEGLNKKHNLKMTEEDKRKMTLDYKQALDKLALQKEGERELKSLDDWVNEQTSKAKPENRAELRKYLHKKYESRKKAIKQQYHLK